MDNFLNNFTSLSIVGRSPLGRRHCTGHIPRTILLEVPEHPAALADHGLLVASGEPASASAASSAVAAAAAAAAPRGRGLLGGLLFLLLELGTECGEEVLAPASRAGGQAVVSFDLGDHLPGVDLGDVRHLHFMRCGLLEKWR